MSYFRLPYFLFPYSKHAEIKNDLIDAIYEETGISIDNIDQIKKTDFFTSYDKRKKKYHELLINNNFTDEINAQIQTKSIGPWKLIDLWYQVYTNNGNHSWHVHGTCHWSFVYYVQLPENSKGTIVRDPYNLEQIDLNQKEGDIFIFPSQIKHCSPINFDHNEKIIVAGNIDDDAEYYEAERPNA
jgi:hypothetical protein